MARSSTDPVFAALADPHRRAILDRLKDGQRPAGELGAGLSISQPAVSQHLAVLLDAGLVSRERRGRVQMYELVPGVLSDVAEWVGAYSKFWDDRLNKLGEHLAKRRAATTEHPPMSPPTSEPTP